MYDRVTILDIIDKAYDEQRYCASCGAPTALRTVGDTVILECSALADPSNRSLLARIDGFLMPHTQHVVIDIAEKIAA